MTDSSVDKNYLEEFSLQLQVLSSSFFWLQQLELHPSWAFFHPAVYLVVCPVYHSSLSKWMRVVITGRKSFFTALNNKTLLIDKTLQFYYEEFERTLEVGQQKTVKIE